MSQPTSPSAQPASAIRLMTFDPGHFHAALLMKEMTPSVSPETWIYAPLGTDLTNHLNRVARFNARKDNPTSWQMRIYAGPQPYERMMAERPGNAVMFSGRNLGKIERIRTAIQSGLHVLADKPWLIESAEFPLLAEILAEAERKGVVGYDGMTQRFEISCQLQKELVQDRELMGDPTSVYLESVHYVLKTVAGVTNQRPAWFFDYRQQGEGLSDVGTHLVDLVQWTLFPERMFDYRRDIKVTGAKRWPTVISKADFQRVTGEANFPDYLANDIRDGALHYFCNNTVEYTLCGVPVKLDVKWDFEPAPGQNDTEIAIYAGKRADIEVRQGPEENFRPEIYVVAKNAADRAAVGETLKRRIAALQKVYPGVAMKEAGQRFHVTIPDSFRIGHEAHFAQLADRFYNYARKPATLPKWETPFMLAKYFVTTQGVELARKST